MYSIGQSGWVDNIGCHYEAFRVVSSDSSPPFFFRSNAGQKPTRIHVVIAPKHALADMTAAWSNLCTTMLSSVYYPPTSKLQNMSSWHWWAVGFFYTDWPHGHLHSVFWPISVLCYVTEYGCARRNSVISNHGWLACT